MLEIRSLVKKFGNLAAVNGISFSVEPGEVFGCLGPNGAGKSTTMKMLAGLLEPSRGEILWRGRRIDRDICAFKSILGYVPEQSELYSHLSGLEYLQLVGRLRALPERGLLSRCLDLLAAFGLKSDAYRDIGEYSKGMRQKVLLAAALLPDPEILLLDEPLSGLDVTTTLVVQELIRKLAGQGRIIIYSSHVMELTEQVCSRVLIMHKGEAAACDSVANLRRIMQLPSLTEIFKQLALREDPAETAAGIVALVGSRK